jgi:hypothetical protein
MEKTAQCEKLHNVQALFTKYYLSDKIKMGEKGVKCIARREGRSAERISVE